MNREMIRLTVNGDPYELLASPRQTLLDVIRGPLGLTGTKEGCTTGSCGVCTVHNASGEAVLSCLTPALEWDGEAVTTIEGLETSGRLDEIQQAFIDHHAVQCGFCTPGVIMSARAVLNEHPSPQMDQINDGMSGVICRCTGHIKVREAIRAVGSKLDRRV
ncbi:MAG: (2Fe-2S)-binding protein [Chromatiales bacterium]|nr:(2Fe-2S)-binding protein [Chromatiales bacterium]